MSQIRRFLQSASQYRQTKTYTFNTSTVYTINSTSPDTGIAITGYPDVSLRATYNTAGITINPITLTATRSDYNYYVITIGSGYRFKNAVITFKGNGTTATTLQSYDMSQSAVTSIGSTDVKTITLNSYGLMQREMMFNVSATTIIDSIVVTVEQTFPLDDISKNIFVDGTYSYRIPSITKINTGRLIAIACRIVDNKQGGVDIGTQIASTGAAARIDLVMKISDNLGKTWSNEAIVVEHSETDSKKRGYGDAAMGYDSVNNKVYIYCCCGSISYTKSTVNNTLADTDATKYDNAIRVAKIVGSIDVNGGITWEAPIDVTAAFYQAINATNSGLTKAFCTSGRMLYHSTPYSYSFTKDGVTDSITFPAGFMVSAATNSGSVPVSIVPGTTDTYTAYKNIINGSEAKILEANCPQYETFDETNSILNYGKFIGPVMICRTSKAINNNIPGYIGSRPGFYYHTFYFNALLSGPPTSINGGYTIKNNTNNGAFSYKLPGSKTTTIDVEGYKYVYPQDNYLIMKSSPFGSYGTDSNLRKNLGIMYRNDYMRTFTDGLNEAWEGCYQISNTSSAYSDIVYLGDNKLGIIYEETLNTVGSGYNIKFITLDISELTHGNYSL